MATSDFLTVADTHYIASDSSSNLLGSVGDTAASMAKFAALSLGAAANEISNIPANVGNLFGGNFETKTMRDRLVERDSNMLSYYDDHQSGIDLTGFVVGSFVPGIGGTKILNYGTAALRNTLEAGRFGTATGKALGLLVPSREKYLTAAIKELGATNQLMNANAKMAVASGFVEQGLQAFAWETAVAATMQSSPILDQMTAGDLAKNILTGSILGAGIGGVLTGAGTFYRLGREVSNINKELRPYSMTAGTPEFANFTPSEQIISYRNAIEELRAVPDLEAGHALADRASKLRVETEGKLWNKIHEQVNKVTNNDGAASLALMDHLKISSADDTLNAMLYSSDAVRIGTRTGTESALSKLQKQIKELTGSKNWILSDKVSKELAEAEGKLQVSYIRVHGGEAGTMVALDEAPAILSLTDKYKNLAFKYNGVYDGSKKLFSHNTGQVYSVIGKSHLEAESRYFWADALPKWDAMTAPKVIGGADVPLLEKALRDLDSVTIALPDKTTAVLGSKADIEKYLLAAKVELPNILMGTESLEAAEKALAHGPLPAKQMKRVLAASKRTTAEEAAKIVNVKQGWLGGDKTIAMGHDARAADRAEYLARTGSSITDPLLLPKHLKIVSDTTKLQVNGHEVDAISHLAAKEVLYRESAERAVSANLGINISEHLPTFSKTELFTSAVEGQRAFASVNSGYGTAGSKAQLIGSKVHQLTSQVKAKTGELLTPPAARLGNDLEGAIEWSVLNEKVRVSNYRYNLVGNKLIADLPEADLAEKIAAGDTYAVIQIKNQTTIDIAAMHQQLNSGRQSGLGVLDAAAGINSRRNPNHFYPIPRNPKDTPYFAYVVDSSVQGAGHNQMLYAATPEGLELLKAEALKQKPHLKVLTKAESEEFFKVHGQYDFEKTMNDKLIDVSKGRSGSSASLMPRTDPAAIVKETMEWHYARDAAYVRANVSHLYQPEFDALRAAGSAATQAGKSQFGYINALAGAETSVANPHTDLIKMALDISKSDPLWTNVNTMVDNVVSRAWNTAKELAAGARSDVEFARVNAALRDAGATMLVDSDAMYRALNATVPRGALSTFVNKANAVISTFALRWDALNALNNTVGSAVLLVPETKALIKAIESGSAAGAGELAALAKIAVPGTDQHILSAEKLIARAITKFHADKEGRAFFKQHGFTSTISEQYDQSLDIVAAAIGSGKIDDAVAWMRKAGSKGEALTGNTLAEEFNRYVAASVMKDITDVALKHGVLKSEAEALSYINTFVNRTQGNYLASQRPMLFQGPIGQAVGLFQTYQFNLIQQLLRHVGEGDAKSAMLMMGLQGGIYGVQGLPAFNAINTHIIGSAAGNTNHQDIYKTVYETAGKTGGEWLMFGGLSNITSSNMYTRGDVNPRHLFVIPTSPADVPIYQATAKVLGNIYDTAANAMQGAPVGQTLMRGLEHNGISRPLAGMAQVLEGMATGKVESTNKQQNILMSHDVATWASLTRLVGGKPMDEAIVQDQLFRANAYRAVDKGRKDNLGEAIKLGVLAGEDPTAEQLLKFQADYLKAGGKSTEFNQYMIRQYRNASVPQADQIRAKLADPRSQMLQLMMGGAPSGNSELGNPNY